MEGLKVGERKSERGRGEGKGRSEREERREEVDGVDGREGRFVSIWFGWD